MVTKGEIACFQQFLLLLPCFKKAAEASKSVYMRERVNILQSCFPNRWLQMCGTWNKVKPSSPLPVSCKGLKLFTQPIYLLFMVKWVTLLAFLALLKSLCRGVVSVVRPCGHKQLLVNAIQSSVLIESQSNLCSSQISMRARFLSQTSQICLCRTGLWPFKLSKLL